MKNDKEDDQRAYDAMWNLPDAKDEPSAKTFIKAFLFFVAIGGLFYLVGTLKGEASGPTEVQSKNVRGEQVIDR